MIVIKAVPMKIHRRDKRTTAIPMARRAEELPRSLRIAHNLRGPSLRSQRSVKESVE